MNSVEEREQFETQLAEIEPALRQFARKLMKGYRHLEDDMSDLYQETILRGFRSYGSFDKKASFRNWMFTIMARLNQDRIRRWKRRPESRSVSYDSGFGTFDDGGEKNPIHTIEYAFFDEIDRSKEGADENTKYSIEEMRTRFPHEIAFLEQYNEDPTPLLEICPETTIRTRAMRARNRLREAFILNGDKTVRINPNVNHNPWTRDMRISPSSVHKAKEQKEELEEVC